MPMNQILLTLCLILIIVTNLLGNPIYYAPECKIDYENFCKEVKQPKAKITQCLLEHNDDLSEGCKSSLKSYSEKMRNQAKGSCKEDVNKFCKWVIPGGGRIIKCLFKNEDSLSEACKKVLNE